MRGDRLIKSELLDLFHFEVQGKDDPHPFFTFVLQFATGKTNHGTKLFGRVARNADITQCPFGAIAMHLRCQMSCSNEMEDPAIDFAHKK